MCPILLGQIACLNPLEGLFLVEETDVARGAVVVEEEEAEAAEAVLNRHHDDAADGGKVAPVRVRPTEWSDIARINTGNTVLAVL